MPKFKYVIVNSVPIPVHAYNREYPFSEMEIGDSFRTRPTRTAFENTRYASIRYGLRHNMRFASRWNDGKDPRLWRIATREEMSEEALLEEALSEEESVE